MKIKILSNGSLQKIIGTKYFIVKEKFSIKLQINKERYLIVVPVGFITDLGSIPSILFFFDKSRYISYIFHDYLYSLIGEITNINGKLNYNQEFVDELLILGLEIEEMNKIGQVIILNGLRIGGNIFYKKENKEISKLKKLITN